MPPPSGRTLRVVPIGPRSVGCLPTFCPPQRGCGHRAVHGQPLPSNPLHSLVFDQTGGPPRQEDARRRPRLAAARGGTTGPEASFLQRVPLTPGTPDEEHGLPGLTLINAGPMAPQRVELPGGSSRWRRAHHSSGMRQARWTCSWSGLIEPPPVAENFCPQETITTPYWDRLLESWLFRIRLRRKRYSEPGWLPLGCVGDAGPADNMQHQLRRSRSRMVENLGCFYPIEIAQVKCILDRTIA